MSQDNESGRITIANLIAITAMAFLAFFTFFGYLYVSDDGQFGKALLYSTLDVLLLSFMLVLSIKAKSAKSHFGMWRIIMIVALVLYVVVAFVFRTPLLNYFNVMSDKSCLQQKAYNELDAIESMYTDYDDTMKRMTSEATQRLTEYVRAVKNGASKSSTVDKYISDMNINRDSISNWGALITKVWRLRPDDELSELRNKVQSWGFFDLDIAQVGLEIDNMAESVVSTLNKKVIDNVEKHKIIPVITINDNHYAMDGFVQKEFTYNNDDGFHNALSGNDGITITGWTAFILLHLLILLNFIVTETSGVVMPKNGKKQSNNDWGVTL